MSNLESIEEKALELYPTEYIANDANRAAFIAGAKYVQSQQLSWVSVDSNPPEQDKWMLLFNGHWIGVGKYDKCEDEEFSTPEWQDETHEYIHPIPTHWMPLPAPPSQSPPIESEAEVVAVANMDKPLKGIDAEKIVKMLSDWSLKYPRGPIYPMSKMSMDNELIEIEKAAKQFCENKP